MALYDTADLVARFKRLARRPVNDAALETTDIYRYLTDGQLYWLGQFMNHFPRLNWETWEKMTAAADKKSFTFDTTPLGSVEVYASERGGPPLRAGAPWDMTADFYWDGQDTIRIPGDRPREFANGPWARFVPRPPDIAANVEPILQPLEARLLIVYHAASQWAHEGGLENPETFEDLADSLWNGKRPGDNGLLGTLKQRFGSSSHGGYNPWYKSLDLSNLPISTS